MADIKTQIDELIEESYLRGLTDEDIRTDVLQFVEACHEAVKNNSRDKRTMEALLGELTRLRTEVLAEVNEGGGEDVRVPHESLAHQAAQAKLRVVDTIRSRDRRLASIIEQWRSQNTAQSTDKTDQAGGGLSFRSREIAIRLLYASLVTLAVVLAYWRFIEPR